MPADVFLDDAALRKLTGFAHKARQVEQLRRMGVPFWVNGRGQAVVACSAVQGSKPAEVDTPKQAWVPRVLRRA
jgi:hypothetical protein